MKIYTLEQIGERIAYGKGLLTELVRKSIPDGDYTAMTAEEKKQHETWEKMLTSSYTLQDLAVFIDNRLTDLNKELREAVVADDSRKALKATARIENYEAICSFITEPDRKRESVITRLQDLIKQNTL